MDAEQKLAHIKELARARVKKHYEANREEINRKRKEAYAAAHPKPEVEVEKLDTVVIKKVRVKKNQQLSGEMLSLLKEQNKEKYIKDLKAIVDIIGTDNLFELNKTKVMVKKLNESLKKNGEPYAINSIKAFYQCILYLIDHAGLKVKKEPYFDQFQMYKMKSVDMNNDKKEEVVPTFKEYLGKVATTFGTDSKMYLIGSLYDAFTIRDNYQLKIVDAPDNETENFLVLSPMRIIINAYKTQGYGQMVFKPKKALASLITGYMERTKLGVGDYLLGSQPLSSYIAKNNETMGYKGSVNLYRHMKVTEQLATATPEQRLKLAKTMGHQPMTQMAYLKSLKLT